MIIHTVFAKGRSDNAMDLSDTTYEKTGTKLMKGTNEVKVQSGTDRQVCYG